ncbi:methyltransferase domain-containing protein [Algoriphagus boritolerans]|uniref:Methyltransferase small domain-containing protein n=1 Tax=Algoriphagus boritolerans DSM 17298 = JCM 18970 TaxID=1120964 RepID=A0A1H5RW22_9BACT|nr:class I SAM-dependent methyltransferase [Algoriphagus boritolerans]SEF42314.1 Methyltransferase small domain-containing protein [Algoriphagus boritolerans DSM 17298 = JCM 18970]
MSVLSNNVIWNFLHPLAEVFADLYQNELKERNQKYQEDFKQKYLYLLSNGVRRGPFKGLKYPFLSSIYSAFYPKVLGYYEMELHPILDKLKSKKFNSILDIGCAEGYYAVGLAKMFPNSKIVAYDIDPLARQRTQEMASANQIRVGDRFELKEYCTANDLLGLDPTSRHLIFSDCEGFEGELFSVEVISHLSKSDFIIEVHDFEIPGLCDRLYAGFSATHLVELIKSIDDLYRYRYIEDPELLSLNLTDQIQLLAEKRPAQMEWLYCTSLPLGI